ncbi:hypothetical protein ACOME3_009590 [Neoechinorhynchus agilis]
MELHIVDPSSPLSWPCLVANELATEKAKVLVGDDANGDLRRKSISDYHHQQPVLTCNECVHLFTTNSISFALSTPDLRMDKCRLLQAELINWIDFAKSEIYPAVETFLYPYIGLMDANKENVAAAKSQLVKIISLIDSHLKTLTFLVGDRFSLADITVFSFLVDVLSLLIGNDSLRDFVHFNRYWRLISNQSVIKKVIGTFKPCTKAPADLENGTRGNLKRIYCKAAAVQKKQVKEVASKTAEELSFAEQAENDVPDKDPFASMPKGSFDMDEFKRVYSNNDTVTVAIPYFWNKFDAKNYSVWHCVYKYPEELRLTFMTANLVSGMMQRLDKMRKYAFGSICIFGEDNKNQISGIWIWRGHNLAFELSPDWSIDYESYTWRKIDDPQAEKKLINEFFSWECNHEGMKFNQGKIFK